MSQNQQPLYPCSRCGTKRPAAELNGLDPLTGDTSKAYCRRIAQCQSDEARSALDWVITNLNSADTAA